MSEYDALIIGAGPSGLATVCALLDSTPDGDRMKILWVDKDFNGGRFNGVYREISSNTKVKIYLSALDSSKTCQSIIGSTESPNAVTRLAEEEGDGTCPLSMAGDMVMMLLEGVLNGDYGVESEKGKVEEATYTDECWNVRLESGKACKAKRLFLCTGSQPIVPDFHSPYNESLKVLDLDECLVASQLPDILPSDSESTIAVIGSSHSGVLVTRNLFELHQSGKRKVKVVIFQKEPIKYAEYRDDGIVWDNTGLKGATAEWAKDILAKGGGESVIRQVDISEEEKGPYEENLPKCTHIIYAIGYSPNPYPRLVLGDEELKQDDLHFDMHSSGFKMGGEDGKVVPALFGMGIAHPEMVEDPEGHMEAAVGVAKFFKFGERVGPRWVEVKSA